MCKEVCFNPLDRGNLYQISQSVLSNTTVVMAAFQSPRSGKFVSDAIEAIGTREVKEFKCFNPLDRGNLYQIKG